MSSWVLLRGLSRESRHWDGFPERLGEVCGAAPIVAIDLPGNGRLNHQQSPLAVAPMVDSCRRQLAAAGAAPPYVVLAMSLGAVVAVAWAERHPEELAGGVLINTSLRPFSPWYHRLRPTNYLDLLGLLWAGDAGQRERTILRLTSNRPPSPQTLAEWTDYARQNPVSPANVLRQLLAAARFTAPAAAPPVPLLVLASSRDRLVDPRCSRQMAWRWQTAFAEHPAAGHDLPLDDGAWVARQVGYWLPSLGGPAMP
ncbi:MAG: alpha/beta hydrolase [Betaproteobacteria bacterium HGW-Betaproteobacteria-12]|nr:MAG: alpha/beta hydrolase [Betaproteobacteria bacterium HGW-Betaproteobacteria-12]